jgi:hypothetical protein
MYVFRGLIHWGFQLRVGSDPAPLRLRELNDLCIEIQGPHIALTQKDAVRHLWSGEKKGPKHNGIQTYGIYTVDIYIYICLYIYMYIVS